MFRDTKLSRPDPGKSQISDEIENFPTSPTKRPPVPVPPGLSRDPLLSIPDPSHICRLPDTTPSKPFRTPDKPGNAKNNRFGWSVNESRSEIPHHLPQSSRIGGPLNMTPRVSRPANHTTPTKSVSRPSTAGFAPMSTSRLPGSISRTGNYAALSRGLPISNGLPMVVNSVDVPHFDLKEDTSFWMNHSVQVIIRVRPLNSAERGVQGFNRCVKQESSQTITWIGQPETRFTFDHVACETVDQEMLFRKAGLPMVENCLSGYNSCMFAYGQTGSGKTYTMLGDIDDMEFKPSPHRGMTPRIFEYLFARIRAEEELRGDDHLKYSCKCSFLEIYNEQITDLLNPSSANLPLREDMRKGIFVENLSEFEVDSVHDILNLLAQGSLNRKVAATNMNKESSRSHCVFTCVIESKWERDSTTNLRFARLNLVDLAGSERQKSSGAEGERLKEAASINLSLTTLGHVMMVLVDIANGKRRHVPYRDSKLTFLLQDSIGGNSKTIIIANISPSTSCAAETLNTLKFAQRGKLIQNNAIVNEDSCGDVSALQLQIQRLNEELSALKRQHVSRSLSFGHPSLQHNTEDHEDVDMEIDQPMSEDSVSFEAEVVKMSPQQFKSLEKTLAGALRREQMAETSIKKLETEIEHLNLLVHQREEDTRCSNMKLKFREDKIRRMESLIKGVKPVDSYLLEENAALSEEIQMIQEKVDRNPEVTRFALENIRLLEQVRRFQDYYEEGERENLLSEVTDLRDKLIQLLDENNKQHVHSKIPIALKEPTVPEQKVTCEDMLQPTEELLKLELELDILKIILKEERSSRAKADELATYLSRDLKLAKEGILSTHKQYEDVNIQLKEAKSMIEVLESQHLLSINELEGLKNKNRHYVELWHKQELELVAFKQQTSHREFNDSSVSMGGGKRHVTQFQLKFDKIQASLDKAKMLNASYQRDHEFQKANEEEMDEIRQQVEEETAQVILCLQEELSALQQQVQDSSWKEKDVESRLTLLETTLLETQDAYNALARENEALMEQIKEKEKYLELISKDWQLLCSEIEGSLSDGHEALIDASEQLDAICVYVPKKGRWISEQVHRLIKQASEKESVIEELNACLENANARLNDTDCMLRSLKGAALVITESNQKECSEKEKEIHRLRCELSAKSMVNMDMESRISLAYEEMRNSSRCATTAFVIVSRLSEMNFGHLDSLKHIELQLRESIKSNEMKDGLLDKCAAASDECTRQIEALRKELALSEESCTKLGDELAKKQVSISVMERQLEEHHELDILMTKEILCELQEGVSIVKSCMNDYAEQTAKTSTEISELDNAEDREEHYAESVSRSSKTQTDVKESGKSIKTCKDDISKDGTIALLRREIESALESLKEVQAEVLRFHAEKQELSNSERKSHEGMGMVKTQIYQIQAAFGNFEDQCLYKMKALNQKLEKVEQHSEEAIHSWCQAKEIFEGDLSNATVDIAKKTAEATCLLSKFEEAQDIMKEADVMIKGLTIANETMKLEIEDLKKENLSLSCERDSLSQDIQSLHSYAAVNNQQCQELIQEVEFMISQTRGTSEEAILSISNDISSVKSQLLDSRRLIQSWLEDIWSETIVKDSAVSVLYNCHMGKLLEAVTGLNAENSLLHNGLLGMESKIFFLQEDLDLRRVDLEKLQCSHSFTKEELCQKSQELQNRNEATASQEENFFMELSAKDLELVYMTSELQQLADVKAKMEAKQVASCMLLEHLKIELVTLSISSNVREQLLLERDAEVIHLQKEHGEDKLHLNRSCAALKEKYILQLTEMSFFNENLIFDLHEALEGKDELTDHLLKLEIEHSNLADKSLTLEEELISSSDRLLILDRQNQDLVSKMKFLEQGNYSLKEELDELKRQSSMLIADVQDKDSEVKSYEGRIHILNLENGRLQESIHGMESKILFLQEDLDFRRADLEKLQCSHSSSKEELCQKSQELQNHNEATASQEENFFMELSAKDLELVIMTSELQQLADVMAKMEAKQVSCYTLLEHLKIELVTLSISSNVREQLLLERDAEVIYLQKEHREANLHLIRSCAALKEKYILQLAEMAFFNENLKCELHEALEGKKELTDHLLKLETEHINLTNKSITLQEELVSLSGRLLILDRQKQDLVSKLKFMEQGNHSLKEELDELKRQSSILITDVQDKDSEVKSCEGRIQILNLENCRLQESIHGMESKISFLQEDLDLRREDLEKIQCSHASTKEILCHKNQELQNCCVKMNALEEENGSLKDELRCLQFNNFEANASLESLKSELEEVTCDRDHLHKELLVLEENLDTAQALAEEYEAMAVEAKQIAESSRIYGEEKEEEVKLLEKSVQELDRTVDALENKLDILKEETERQRLQREDLEMELHSLKDQMHNLRSADSGIKRHLEEKEQNLQKALKNVQKLEKDLTNKDTEISHCKAHITELNLHAEAQASEYKKKFKALEAMAGQVKTEGASSHGKSSTLNKLEKNATKPRGSGSPFKCIGLGLAQQLKLEKDEDLTEERLHIQELEALAANRQKEIFVLNNRLASAESMTHDVIRDLLGVKLDMTNYASLLDKQQVKEIAESAQPDNVDSKVKVVEINKLKKLLSDFVEERKGWLEEIDRRQAELLAAQLALEKLHQRNRSVTAENEVLKVDVEKYKNKVVELEGEVNKLSEQQNLHQRIHHHAKIKEENNILKTQNEELLARLEAVENFLMRFKTDTKDVVLRRSCNAKYPNDFDEEKRLRNKLKDTKAERVRLAHELLGLCTSILKAAGVHKLSSDIDVASAEEALEQLRSRITSLERELKNLKLKSRIENERIRLSEIMQSPPPPLRTRADDNCTTPRRASQSPFFSALDR